MQRREVHLRNYINIIREYDFVIAVSFLLVFGSALIVSLHLPKSYEASTLILVKKSSSSGSSSPANVFQSILSGKIEQDELQTIKRRFITDSLLENTIDKLGEGVKYLPSIKKLKKCIYPKIVPDTRYIKLSVRLEEEDGGERNAAILANALVENLQKIRYREELHETEFPVKFLEKKIKELEAQIKTEEGNLQNFMKDKGIPMIWEAEFSKLLDQRAKLIETRQQTESGKVVAKLELEKLEQELEDSIPKLVEYSKTVNDNPIWVEQVNSLKKLKSKIAGLKARVGEDSPELKGLLAQKKEHEKQLKELIDKKSTSITKQLSPIYIGLINRKIEVEIRQERAEKQLKRLGELIKVNDSKLEKLATELPEKQFRFDQISKKLKLAYDTIKELLRQKNEADFTVAKAKDGTEADKAYPEKGGVEVIDRAYPEKIAVSPRIKFISAVAGIIGLAIGLTAALMLEYFDDTYKTLDEAQFELELDILGVIPESDSEDVPAQSSVIESYDILASNINFACLDKDNRLIMLTSSTQDEGRSKVIANLGINMAKAKNKVLIVDANLRNGRQHGFFGLPSTPGLTNLLSEDTQKTIDETIQTTEFSNLDLLPAGLSSPNPIELLNSNNMNRLIDDLKSDYDVILFDTHPVFPVADTLVLVSKLDECILIADLNQTSRDTVIRAKERLKKVDINLLGLVCNRVKNLNFDYL